MSSQFLLQLVPLGHPSLNVLMEILCYWCSALPQISEPVSPSSTNVAQFSSAFQHKFRFLCALCSRICRSWFYQLFLVIFVPVRYLTKCLNQPDHVKVQYFRLVVSIACELEYIAGVRHNSAPFRVNQVPCKVFYPPFFLYICMFRQQGFSSSEYAWECLFLMPVIPQSYFCRVLCGIFLQALTVEFSFSLICSIR